MEGREEFDHGHQEGERIPLLSNQERRLFLISKRGGGLGSL
jgi:hypothetical protein